VTTVPHNCGGLDLDLEPKDLILVAGAGGPLAILRVHPVVGREHAARVPSLTGEDDALATAAALWSRKQGSISMPYVVGRTEH
jgi:hypothetical protein